MNTGGQPKSNLKDSMLLPPFRPVLSLMGAIFVALGLCSYWHQIRCEYRKGDAANKRKELKGELLIRWGADY